MAALNIMMAAVLLSRVGGDPNVLQLSRAQSDGSSLFGSSGSDAVRSGFLPAVNVQAVGSTSSSSSSGSSSAPGSVSLVSSGSGSSAGNAERSALFGTTQSGVTLSSSQNDGKELPFDGSFDSSGSGDVTITQETTVDVFKTVTNVIYNSIPITLTEFIKTTAVLPTFQVRTTPVDDNVFVATAPVTRTDSVTVTNTNTGFIYVTEVSTDTYTITHRAYQILQKTLTSTLQQTQIFRPTVVRTRITTEYDTQTVEYLATNTIVIQPRSTLPFGGQETEGFGGQPGSQGFGGQQGSQGFSGQQGSQGFSGQQGSQGFSGQQGSQGFGGQQGSQQGSDRRGKVREGFVNGKLEK